MKATRINSRDGDMYACVTRRLQHPGVTLGAWNVVGDSDMIQ